jgi:hypothetical protein
MQLRTAVKSSRLFNIFRATFSIAYPCWGVRENPDACDIGTTARNLLILFVQSFPFVLTMSQLLALHRQPK